MKLQIFNGWLVDNKGGCVCVKTPWWEDMLNRGRPDDEQFKPIEIAVVQMDAPDRTVLIHRPSGGLGDMICALPAIISYIKRHPDYNITIAIPESYHWLFKQLPVTIKAYKEFHSAGFNTVRNCYRYQFFLWCPAGFHELETDYKPTKSRIQNFAEAFSVPPRKPILRLQ